MGSKFGPVPVVAIAINGAGNAIKGLHQVPVEQQVHEPCWGQLGQGKMETEPIKRSPTQHTAQWSCA